MKVITITLNPAFDMHCDIDNFEIYKENYATSYIKHAGGKGINISRALTTYGVENTAYCVVGDDGGDEFLRQLDNDGIVRKPIVTKGKIRENITIHSKGKETRISFEGFFIDNAILDRLYEMLEREKCDDLVVTFTGRLCDGVTVDEVIDFLAKIKGLGAKLIVDCNSFTREQLVRIKPYMIKPNEEEIVKLVGKKDVTESAAELCKDGIENVIISLGAEGFIYCGQWGTLKIDVPNIPVVSTIGAGDSLIAGFIAGHCEGRAPVDVLTLAAAFGTAACMTEGTNPPTKDTIALIEHKIKKSLSLLSFA